MKVFRGLPAIASHAPCALTIGNFDGVHRGHQALLAQVREAADRLGIAAAVMTFEPHPREFFAKLQGKPELAPPRIANLRDKLQGLATACIDHVIVEHFNAEFAALSPEAFIKEVLVDGLNVKWLMVGEDFCFGARRMGTIETLIAAGKQYGFEVHTFGTVSDNGERISSSAIRHALHQGDFAEANHLLGYPYMISSRVVHGKKLGRTIGFPTMNMRIAHNHPALSGIFAVQVHGLGDAPIQGVASLGIRPTVDDSGRVLLETYLFDFSGNAYGKLLQVEFLKKLRDEEKYVDLPTLIDAINLDVINARAYFKEQASFAKSATDRI
jgi:riboflavin kinase/FMN adenylyltransferase